MRVRVRIPKLGRVRVLLKGSGARKIPLAKPRQRASLLKRLMFLDVLEAFGVDLSCKSGLPLLAAW